MSEVNNRTYAVLIDAENVSYSYGKVILDEIVKYGSSIIRRIYGNWSNDNLKKWQQEIYDLSLTPRQQFSYTKGKNTIDMLLVIDAMDILYSNSNIDGFCIVSSDSDYIPLVNRLKESNMHIIGMGEEKTPEPFYNSCDKFIYLENLKKASEGNSNQKNVGFKPVDKKIVSLIKRIVTEHADDEGKLNNAKLVPLLERYQPEFDPRSYGYTKLSEMLRKDKSLSKIFDLELKNLTLSVMLK